MSGLSCTLNTHKARRTFGSTVTLNNNIPIHIIKEMLDHHSIKQSEEYALTEQATVSREMELLQKKLNNDNKTGIVTREDIFSLEDQLSIMKKRFEAQEMA